MRSSSDKGIIANKMKLIQAVEEFGGAMKAVKAAGIHAATYYRWMKEAQKIFGEGMLEIAIDRVKNPEKGKGSDVLLLGLLNAYMPDKFRPAAVVANDTAKELITEWRKAAREQAKEKRENILTDNIEDTLDDILNKKK
jgi:molybdenum-dependent DNA-binding transcriptional regulator ModE